MTKEIPQTEQSFDVLNSLYESLEPNFLAPAPWHDRTSKKELARVIFLKDGTAISLHKRKTITGYSSLNEDEGIKAEVYLKNQSLVAQTIIFDISRDGLIELRIPKLMIKIGDNSINTDFDFFIDYRERKIPTEAKQNFRKAAKDLVDWVLVMKINGKFCPPPLSILP